MEEAVKMLENGYALESDLSNQVELHISCSSLPKLDSGSQTDPFVVVYVEEDS